MGELFRFFSVDGNWTAWTEWGECDRSCGLGKVMRQRWCTNPRPMSGGSDCSGENMEIRPCNDYPCIGMHVMTNLFFFRIFVVFLPLLQTVESGISVPFATCLYSLGYYLSDFGQSCTNLCEGLGEEFACMALVDLKNNVFEFYNAIDFSDYRKTANVSCTTDETTDYFQQPTDPSFVTDTGVCRGYKDMNRTDCGATGGQNIRRLCKCLDRGQSC